MLRLLTHFVLGSVKESDTDDNKPDASEAAAPKPTVSKATAAKTADKSAGKSHAKSTADKSHAKSTADKSPGRFRLLQGAW
jgi:hypothetical protein